MSVRCAVQVGPWYGAVFLRLSLHFGCPSRYGEVSRNHVGTSVLFKLGLGTGQFSSTSPCSLAVQVGTEKSPETMSVRCAVQVGPWYRAVFLHVSLLHFGCPSRYGEVSRNHVGTVCCSSWALVQGNFPPPLLALWLSKSVRRSLQKPCRYGVLFKLGLGTGQFSSTSPCTLAVQVGTEKSPETMSVRCAVQIGPWYGAVFLHLSLLHFGCPNRYGEVSRNHVGTVCCSSWALVRGSFPPPLLALWLSKSVRRSLQKPCRYGVLFKLGLGTGQFSSISPCTLSVKVSTEKSPETMSVRCAVQIGPWYGAVFLHLLAALWLSKSVRRSLQKPCRYGVLFKLGLGTGRFSCTSPCCTLVVQVGAKKSPETMSVRCAVQVGPWYGAVFLHFSLLHFGCPSRYGEVSRNHVGTVCCSSWALVRGGFPALLLGALWLPKSVRRSLQKPCRYGVLFKLGLGTELIASIAALWLSKSVQRSTLKPGRYACWEVGLSCCCPLFAYPCLQMLSLLTSRHDQQIHRHQRLSCCGVYANIISSFSENIYIYI